MNTNYNNMFRFPLDCFNKKTVGNAAFGETLSEVKRYAIFTAYEYTIANKKTLEDATVDTDAKCAIALPLPGGLSESFGQSWSMETPLSAQGAIKGVLNKLGNGLGEAVSGLLQTKTGLVLAPAQELLYQGPEARQMNFSYDLIPTSQEEVSQIKMIIYSFKRFSLPNKNGAFLSTPCLWEIELQGINDSEYGGFVTMGFKDRKWALTSVDFNYSPDGNFVAFHSGFPVKINMTLNFSEVFPMYRDDEKSTTEELLAIIEDAVR